MGSSQKPDRFDQQRLAQHQVELAPRRSGGGAVYIDPNSTVWIDVVAPRTSSLWSSELAENFLIVGRLWQQALMSLGVSTQLCAEAPERTPAASLACWAGVGWGELTIEGAKVVGLSQRRTRWGARVQAMAVLDGSARLVADYLLSDDADLVRATQRLADPGLLTKRELLPKQLETAVVAAFTDFVRQR